MALDSEVSYVSLSPQGKTLVAGDATGVLYCLEMHHVESGGQV
jgi:hypothetical protein